MPEKKIQEQLDAQIAAKRVAQVVEVSEAPAAHVGDIRERCERNGDCGSELQRRVCPAGRKFRCPEVDSGSAEDERETYKNR